MPMLFHFRASRSVALATLAGLAAALGSCSSSTAPSEPVVYTLVSICGRPLPTWSDASVVMVDRLGTIERWELYVLSGTLTLAPNGTWRTEKRVLRRRDGVVIEDLGTPGMWGTYRWKGDSLFALRKGPPLPPGAVALGCCTFPYQVSADGQILRGHEHNQWPYVYQLGGQAP